MTHAINARYEDQELHPHQPAGSPKGGEFAPKGGKTPSKTPAKTGPPRRRQPARRSDDGTMSYDPASNRGTGYDSRDGDPRVHKLQQALNRLGFTDRSGKALRDDGQLGPKTTSAVKKAQRRLGLPADGKVTPEFLQKLTEMKTLPRVRAAANEPYGDVEYADPGYQPDGKKRYPLDSEEHCRAAWSYINMPKNAAMYTAEQLAEIKAKIRAALREYDVEVSDDVKAAAAGSALLDVELARPGLWKLSSGDTEFTAEMLQDAADFFEASGGQAVPIKLGHTDDRFDGEPTFGNLRNVRYDEDDRGPVLIGDITDMPGWLAAAAPKRWPNRSIEGWQNFTYDGREYSLVLSGLVFLGVTPPGVRNIRSLADLQVALAASSALRIVASAPPDDPAEPPDDLSEPPEAPPSAGLFAAQTPAAEAEEQTPEETRMDPEKIREALGLPADASDDEVKAAVVTAGLAPAPVPEPVTASAGLDKAGSATAARGGLITIDPAQLEQFNAAMVRAAALDERLRKQDRDSTITDAVKAGKFPPARRAHYEKLWDVDPVGTKEVIASLASGLIPVTASGYDTDAEDRFTDAEFEHLFPPVHKEASRG